jgi:DNA-binding response OmpR family regulator
MSKIAKRILIVDDDEAARSIIAQVLRRDNYHIDQAGSGDMALEKVIHNRYDLLILDYMMPDLDGLDVLLKVKELNPETKVIMITAAHLSIDKVLDTLKKGASHYVTKPFEVKTLRKIVNRELADATPAHIDHGRDN